MIVVLPIGKTRVEFNPRIPFRHFDLEFIYQSQVGIFHNITEIERDFRRVEDTHQVDFIGKTRMEIGPIEFYLDLSMFFYPSGEILAWCYREQDQLSRNHISLVEEYLRIGRPVILGTAYAVMPELKVALKQEIRDRAMQIAERMRDNGEAIIRYLGES